ncbi:uncharacterized protein LOC117338926 [Pecten maximus]|uniref:uncharacterized protein LOC117338926 n=1 Tax=Pecten maximus TaxID=6579 RepID=UPI0014584681|nr:uncharacterized protein LOC117338926 [Pecten maximus]
MALAELPKAFGIEELAKGYFPHLFNRKENQEICMSHLPDKKYYHPDGMKPKRRKPFMEWYKNNKDHSFTFHEELLKYCRSDVDILRKCCLKFRKMFIQMTNKDGSAGIDPFQNCITIASACNLVYRTMFLESESIGIIPPHGYRPEDKQSIKAMKWLKFIANTEGLRIQHALHDGEKTNRTLQSRWVYRKQ